MKSESYLKTGSKTLVFSHEDPRVLPQKIIPLSPKGRVYRGNRGSGKVPSVLLSGIQPLIDQVLPDYLDDSNFNDHFSTFEKLICLPGDRVHDWGLPGHGDALQTCGTLFMRGCLNVECHPGGEAYFEPCTHRCFSPTCPVCWLWWCKRAAGRISDRIGSYLDVHKKLKAIHVVASVPIGAYHLPVEKLRRLAQRIVKKAGFWGGSCIFHPFRQLKDSSPTFLNSGSWYFSPHFHFIGVGWILGKQVKELYHSVGWIVKNVRVRKTIFGTAFYQLTHAGVWYGESRRSTTTWFGSMSYNKMRMAPIVYGREKCCPYCGDRLVKLLWIGGGDPPLPCGSGYLATMTGWISIGPEFYRSLRYPPGWFESFGKFKLRLPLQTSFNT